MRTVFELWGRTSAETPWQMLKRGETREFVAPSLIARKAWAELMVVERDSIEETVPLLRWVNGAKRPILHRASSGQN